MKPKIIIVDDDNEILDSYKDLLSNEYEVDTANSVEQGIEKLSKNEYDVALTDMNLHQHLEGGLMICNYIATHKPSTKSIIFTAYPSELNRKKANLENVFAYITKGTNETRNDIQKALKEAVHALNQILIKDVSPDHYFDDTQKNALPYAIKQFHIQNYNGINQTQINNIPIDTQWIFLTGQNAYGKTAILQALMIGLFGKTDGKFNLPAHNANIYVELKENQKTCIYPFNASQFRKIAAYGPSRLIIQHPISNETIEEQSAPTYSLFNHDGILLNIQTDMVLWKYEKDPIYQTICDILYALLPHIGKIDVKDKKLIFYEKETGNKNFYYNPIPFSQLSVSHKSIIAMIGDMIKRLTQSHPSIKNPRELSGIVLIDELEAHLHPSWQYQFPGLLSSLFPNIQFIATTHSAIPFLGAPEHSLFLKVNRSIEKGIWVEQIDLDIKKLTPNLILTSPLFDMDDIFHVLQPNINDVRTEDDYKDMIENDRIKNILKEYSMNKQKYKNQLELEDATS